MVAAHHISADGRAEGKCKQGEAIDRVKPAGVLGEQEKSDSAPAYEGHSHVD